MSVWLLSIAKKRSQRCLRLGIQPECSMILHGYRGSSRMRSIDPDPPLTSSGNPRLRCRDLDHNLAGTRLDERLPAGTTARCARGLRYWNVASSKSPARGRLTPERYGPCGFITRRLTESG